MANLNSLIKFCVFTILSSGFFVSAAFATGLNATDALKAATQPKAATVSKNEEIKDPAAQAAEALAAQEELQTSENTEEGAVLPAATAPTTTQAPTAQAVPALAAPPTTQMGVIAPTAETQAASPEAAAPQLNMDELATQDVSIPPLTPATPGMDLPVEPEKTPEEKEAEIREKAFEQATESMMPLRPDEIRKVREMADQNKLAIEAPLLPNPRPESTFNTISLEPGQAPFEIKTAQGHVTTLSILDATGQPWPIQDISWAGNFEVQQPEQGSNMLRITPMSEFAFGNVSMRLIGLTPPVIFSLKTDRRSVQVRADIQIPENGPNATPAPMEAAPTITTAAGDIGMTQILEGVPPAEALPMTVTGVDGRTKAFDVGGITYVRTPHTLLSPAWNASVRSADGMTVYALAYAPVLLLSDKGQLRKARLLRNEME